MYGRVDIGLDPFPYNGTTTTCEALWMGVPVLTLTGNRHASRVGASLLHALDLHGLIAESQTEYVDKAAALAGDLTRLNDLRSGLRERMRRSPLCDAEGFAATIENVYERLWERSFSRMEPVVDVGAKMLAEKKPTMDIEAVFKKGLQYHQSGQGG